MSPKHSNTTPAWIATRFLKIEKMIRESNAAKKLQGATIGRGGITVKDGGNVTVEHGGGFFARWANGRYSAFFGPHTDGSHGVSVALDAPAPDGGYSTVFVATAQPGARGNVYVGDTDVPVETMFVQADLFYILADDTQLTGRTHIEHSTTAAAANGYIDPSDGRIWRSTSSAKNKTDIADADIDPAVVLQMRGRTFRDKGDVERNGEAATTHAGFIAEELDALGLTEFVIYDTDNEPEAIAYDRLTVALLAVLKDQDARLKALESPEATKP